MEFLFWISVALIGWAYAGYPLSMKLLALYAIKPPPEYGTNHPFVTVIIAAANEEKRIYDKLVNTVNLRYPPMEIIVTLDGVTDQTVVEVQRFIEDHLDNEERRVILVNNEKGGKEAAQYEAVQRASGSICVFTDVATMLGPDTLYDLVRHFKDPAVGAVDGMSKVGSDKHSNEGVYLKYENKIREWESATTGLVTMGGCLFAVRTDIVTGVTDDGYDGFVPDLQSDFRTALAAQMFGYKAVLDKDAVATFPDGAESKEIWRKHRTVVRGINNFMHHLHMLNPMNFGMFSYALFCHKLLKWLVPWLMIIAYVSNIFIIVDSWFYALTMAAQVFAYVALFLEFNNKWLKLLKFFMQSNAAIAAAWVSYINGERFVSWEPTKR